MAKINGGVLIGTHRDVSYYFSPSQERWCININELTIQDLVSNVKDVQMSDYPAMDRKYKWKSVIIKIDL